MKATLRTVLCLVLTLCLLLPLTACGKEYRDDMTAMTLCHAVKNSLPAGDGWSEVSKNYVSASSWGEDFLDYLDKTSEYFILISAESDMNIDEIGVFHVAKSSDVNAVKQFVEEYVVAKKQKMVSLLEAYNPTEISKLDAASVKVCGNYVLYTILSDADTATAQAAFETALTPNG